ncbi:MAG: methyltransferase family protein [Candidatus Hodarchaeota archaeon]
MVDENSILRIFLILFGLAYVVLFWGGNFLQKKMTGQSPFALGIGKSGKEKKIELFFNVIFITWVLRLIRLFFFPDFLRILVVSKALSIGIGIIFMSGGLVGLAWVRIAMGASWRVGVDHNAKTKLITRGPFRFSRNPVSLSFHMMYFGSFLIGQDLVLLGLFLINVIFIHLQILQEEKYLESSHADDYRAYRAKVGRYLWKI